MSTRIHLRRPNKAGQIQRSVAKLVLVTFQGKPPKRAKQVIHIDGNPKNNELTNLKWDVDKTYYLPINQKARDLFNSIGYPCIRSFVTTRNLWCADYGGWNADDFIQECAIAIWNVIDAYDKTHCSFKRFVFLKCDWVFKRLYRKHKRRQEIVSIINFSRLETEERPIDCMEELGYTPDFLSEIE